MTGILLAAFIVAGHGNPATVMILKENDSSNGCEVVRSMEFKLPFRGLVDVKPSEDGKKILALSGYGALARIDVASWTVDYQTDGADCISAHSLCELPDGKVAVACSNYRDKLMIVDVTQHPYEPAKQTRTVAMDNFCGGHGVHWDAKRNCLWALAYTNLYKLAYCPETTSVKVLKSWNYSPYAGDPHGHDFVPDGKGGYYFTDNYQVNHFDPDTETFSVGAKFRAIKGFSPSAHGDLYTIAKKNYVTDTLLVLSHGSTDRKAARELVVPGGSFYKTRWMPVPPVFDDVPVPSEKITMWRGETRAVRLHDRVETPFAGPKGVGLRFGALKAVKYALGNQAQPQALQYAWSADRVAWDGAGAGQRIVEISVPDGFRPGTYALSPQVSLTVLDRTLPPASAWQYYLDLWQHPWAVARVRGVEPFSPEHYADMRPLWELLAGAGQKTLTVSLLDRPWNHQCRDAYRTMVRRVRRADGSWSFDYSLFDAYVAFGRSCGLGPQIACYTMCPWSYRVSWEEEDGAQKSAPAIPGQPFFEAYWGPFLDDFAAHLKAKGWFADAVIAMDERSPEDVRIIADFVQKHAPGLKISLAGNHLPSAFDGIAIDVYSQALEQVTPAFLAEVPARRAKGMVSTFYVCCGPTHPNTFMDSPDGEPFWCGFFPAASGLDGFLRWAWNSWGEDAMEDASYGTWKAGDTFLVYPDGSPSWRFLELRNGIVAAEKFRLMKAAGEHPVALARLAERFDLKAAIKGSVGWDALRTAVQEEVNRPKGEIRFASWNIGHFALGKDCNPTLTKDEVAVKTWQTYCFLQEVGADVLGVSEYDPYTLADGSRTSDQDVFRAYRDKIKGPDNAYQNNAQFLNGYEVVDTRVKAYTNHVQDTYYVATRVKIDGKTVTFVQTHLDWATFGEHADDRADQMRTLVADFKDEPYVVISGDFNVGVRDPERKRKALDNPSEYKVFSAAGYVLGNDGRYKTCPAGKTWDAENCYALDNIIVKGLKLRDFKVHDRPDLSDHALVSAVLTFD